MNAAPGFECSSCGAARIKLSLGVFLNAQDVSCPRCGTRFNLDKGGCGRLVELLSELNTANRRVEALRRGPLN